MPPELPLQLLLRLLASALRTFPLHCGLLEAESDPV